MLPLRRLDLKDIPNAVRLVAPDLGVLVVSAVCLGLCGRLAREARRSQPAQEQVRAVGGPGAHVLGAGPSWSLRAFEDSATVSFLDKRALFSCKSRFVSITES